MDGASSQPLWQEEEERLPARRFCTAAMNDFLILFPVDLALSR